MVAPESLGVWDWDARPFPPCPEIEIGPGVTPRDNYRRGIDAETAAGGRLDLSLNVNAARGAANELRGSGCPPETGRLTGFRRRFCVIDRRCSPRAGGWSRAIALLRSADLAADAGVPAGAGRAGGSWPASDCGHAPSMTRCKRRVMRQCARQGDGALPARRSSMTFRIDSGAQDAPGRRALARHGGGRSPA